MKKNVKNEVAEVKNNVEEAMQNAEVKVEAAEEKVEKRTYRSFKDVTLDRIQRRAANVPEEQMKPILDKIASALDELLEVIAQNKNNGKAERQINKKLSHFTKEQILAYLTSLSNE